MSPEANPVENPSVIGTHWRTRCEYFFLEFIRRKREAKIQHKCELQQIKHAVRG